MKATIKSWNLSVTWSDGVTEGLTADLPEYLQDELRVYFQELEDLRAEHDAGLRDEPYNFGKVDDEQMSIETETTPLDLYVTSYDKPEVTAEWDGEDWRFSGALIKKHWDMSEVCFSPTELGYSYTKAAQLTPDEAIAALKLWMDESL